MNGEELIHAVQEGDLARVQELATPQNINYVDDNSDTPLLAAIFEAYNVNNDDIIRALLDVPDIDVDLHGPSTEPPIIEAFNVGNPIIIGMLIDAGVDHYQTFSDYDFSSSSLLGESMIDGKIRIVEELLKRDEFRRELVNDLEFNSDPLFTILNSNTLWINTLKLFKLILPYTTPRILNQRMTIGKTIFHEAVDYPGTTLETLQLLVEYGALPFGISAEGKSLYEDLNHLIEFSDGDRRARYTQILEYVNSITFSLRAKSLKSIVDNEIDISSIPDSLVVL